MFKHLHIVACSPRTGTTLLHEVMVTCFKVDKQYEHEIRFNEVKADAGQIVITKRPKDTMYMPAVIADPEFYVIYLLRDPRDVIVSQHGSYEGMYYSNIRLWREMHGYTQSIANHECFLQIRYEDFVNDPDATQEKIVARFPWLEKRHNFSEYHKHAVVSHQSKLAMNDVRPIAPSSIGKWKANLARIKGQQLTHGSLTPDLIACGYETSADWERMLDGVEPDLSGSRYPDKGYVWARISRRLNALLKVAQYRHKRR
ncbi:MAG: sulfotransferase [Proteobacteria bacterium]|nr:sulfotransferase [Pseudomonadota bacterium]